MINPAKGVAISTIMQTSNSLNTYPSIIFRPSGIMQSMASISLEKRLRRLPLGVLSKKDMGEWRTLLRRSKWRWRDAIIPPSEIATVVPKIPIPAIPVRQYQWSKERYIRLVTKNYLGPWGISNLAQSRVLQTHQASDQCPLEFHLQLGRPPTSSASSCRTARRLAGMHRGRWWGWWEPDRWSWNTPHTTPASPVWPR